MRTPPPLGIFLVAACVGAGWLTAPTERTVAPPVAAAARAPTFVPPPPAAHASYLPANFAPGKYDQELLKIDDVKFADFVQHGLHDEVLDTCRAKLPHASPATCEGAYAATARVSPKFVETRKRLLRGEIDSETFQSLWHQLFVEREIALEQFMSWDDQLALDGVPPGNDMFLALSRWGMDQPEGTKLGLEGPQELTATMQPEGH